MKKLLFALCLLVSSVVIAQRPVNYTKLNHRYNYISLQVDSMMKIPMYDGEPVGVRTNEAIRSGYIAIDTTNNVFYFYSDSTWRAISGVNIYNSDGTLTSNRTLTGNANSLTFTGLSSFLAAIGGTTRLSLNSTSSTMQSPDAQNYVEATDTSININTQNNYLQITDTELRLDTLTRDPGIWDLRWDPTTKKITYSDTAALGGKLSLSDTTNMLLPYLRTTGDLVPLFTTAETSHNTDFTLSNTTAYTVFGRASGTGVPSYVSLDTNYIANFSTMVRPLLSGAGIITYNSATGAITGTEVDGSTTNELQTITNSSAATTHTVTLSNSGGSIQLAEGSGITLTTTGTAADGVVTIASTASGGTVTDFSAGDLSPIFTTSEATTTTTPALSFTLTATGGTYKVLGSPTNAAPSYVSIDTNYIANFSTMVRPLLSGAGIVTYNSATGVITGTEVDGSTTNELQTIAVTGTTTGITTLSDGGGSMTIAGAGNNTVGVSGSTITITGADTYVGTVTSFAATDGNGFDFTVTNATTTPTLTATTTVANTQVMYSNSGAITGAAGMTFNGSSELTLGVAGSSLGALNLTGNTSGAITIKGQAAAGTYNFNLPTTAGTSGYALLSAGGGSSPMTWGSVLLTASNGLTATSGDVKLGGTLSQSTTINSNTYSLILTGAVAGNSLDVENTNGSSSYAAIHGKGSGASTVGVWGEATGNNSGVSGTGVSGVGVSATSTGNDAISAVSSAAYGANLQSNLSSTNTVAGGLFVGRNTTGTPGANIGGQILFGVETSTTANQESNTIQSKWTTVTHASRTSDLVITGVSAATTYTLATFSGSGLTTFGVAGTNKGSIALTGNTSGTVTIQPAAAAGTYTLTLPTDDGDANQVLTTNGSGVLDFTTVPRYAPLVVSETSNTSVTINADETDIYIQTALAGNVTINSPTGTLIQGQELTIRLTDDGTARSITWNSIFRAGTTALPTTTSDGKTAYMKFIYNTTSTKWDFVAYASGF